ncbi:MAG TPA: IS3 family transposase [Spirochaetota bacterium]|nr:IS3 family transposase [Spirochaetota bacterium]
MIRENNSRFSVSKMCLAMNVSRSGYYAYFNRPESARSKRHKELRCEIEKIHAESFGVYGSPNITIALNRAGKLVSRGTVARLMRKHGIQAKTRKKYKATTNSKHNLPVADNILNREFTAERRNQKWVSDITYIWTDEGWLYLAAILDLYDEAIVGWSMDSRMTKELVINALTESCIRRKPEPGGLLHSDRGSQYCSEDYQKEIERWGFICSMSRKGNCWDNAPMESFWGKLKMEWLNERKFKTRDEAKKAVFEYIERFYNRVRLHSKIGYVPPLKMGIVA